MPLERHAKRFLDMLAAAAQADVPETDITRRREAFRNLMRLSGPGVAVAAVEDRLVPGPAGPIAVRLYTPAASPGDLPGVVFFHGGGLVAGGLDTHDSLCRHLALASGCRVLAVDYRLAPEHPFPAAVNDCHAVAVWTLDHAGAFGIDPQRVAIGGDSAGGTLAAVVAQKIRARSGRQPALQVLLCPILDFAGETESRRLFARGYLLDRDMMARDLERYLAQAGDPADPLISPFRAADVAGLCPAHIHTAACDPLRDEGRAYAERLTRAGIATSYTCHPGMMHLFYAMSAVIPYARTAIGQIGAALGSALQAEPRRRAGE